jgi:2-pyrone-4,6-dicarboxylate lactonase
MAEPLLTYNPNPRKPRLQLPKGACNTHCHVFGPQSVFPFAPNRNFTPADAPKEKLFALHDLLGIEYCVIVQSATHGFDNAAVADALAAKGGTYCGVALLPTDVSDAELRRLDAQGFRGVRFHYMTHLAKGASIGEALTFAKRLVDIGWHLQIHCEKELIGELAPLLKRSPVPVVIDHIGRVDASLGLDQPAFRQLLALMEDGKLHVKVSGCDRITRQGPPYADAVPFARKLVVEFGDRTFWGTDWPHPNHAGPIPDDGELVDLIADIAPSEAQRQALLVDNPQRFYRFAKPFGGAR